MCVCFEESFHFRLKGFVNTISHMLYTNKWYKYVLENFLAYFQYTNVKRKERAENTSPNWVLTNIQI